MLSQPLNRMQQQTEIFTKVYVFRTILYRTFDAASRACTMENGEIEEWICFAHLDRMHLTRTWTRLANGNFRCQPERWVV